MILQEKRIKIMRSIFFPILSKTKTTAKRRTLPSKIIPLLNPQNASKSSNKTNMPYKEIKEKNLPTRKTLKHLNKEHVIIKNKKNSYFCCKTSNTFRETDKKLLEKKITRDCFQTQMDLNRHLKAKQIVSSRHSKLLSDALLISQKASLSTRQKPNCCDYLDIDDYFDHQDIKGITLTRKEKELYGSRDLKGYQRLNILGKGGCGIVWLCKDDTNNREYAIKQIPKKIPEAFLITSSCNTQIAKREIEMMKYIKSFSDKCDNIISFKRCHETAADIWIIFEKGGSSLFNLSFKITKNKSVLSEDQYAIQTGRFYKKMMTDLNQFKYLIKSLLSFIGFISSKGIVHSDIKPDNILIAYDRESYAITNMKIIDFGSAFLIANPLSFSSNTPEYMSPEIISLIDRSSSPADITNFIRTTLVENPSYIDMWSLGVTLLEMALACPLWMTQKARVMINNKAMHKTGLFGFKGRQLMKIYLKQIEVSATLHHILEESVIDDIDERIKFEDLLKQMLTIDYNKRITPLEALNHHFLIYN